MIEGCGQSVLSGHRHVDEDMVIRMPLFQGPHTEESLAATAAAGEAEMTISTAVEAEASSVPPKGLALSMSTMDPGEGVTPVSSSECILSFFSFKGVVGIPNGNSHWPFSSICTTQ